MKVLMFSIDKNIFQKGSEARSWMVSYGALVEELHIIVYTKPGFQKEQISSNTFAYSTNTRFRPFYFFHAYKIARKILREKNDFLITSQEAMTNLVAVVLKWRLKIPLQVQLHTDFLSPFFRKESLKNFLRYISYRLTIKYADCNRVVSKRIKDSLLSKSNFDSNAIEVRLPQIDILPIWVDAEKISAQGGKTDLHKKYPQFYFIILMASRLTKEKNIGLAIDSMKEVIKEYPKIGLIIVGEGPEINNLKFKIKNLKLHDNVVLEDWTDDLASYYKTADLFLLTSNYEGYGRTLIEATAAGCKIISSDVGAANEILEKDNIFNPGDKKELKEKIIKALKGQIKVAKLIQPQSKEEYLEKYKKSWEQCVY